MKILYLLFLFKCILATEWCGADEPLQPVFVQLHPDQVIKVVAANKSDTRRIHLKAQQAVEITHSDNAGSKTLRIRIPKEYDLVRIQIFYQKHSIGL